MKSRFKVLSLATAVLFATSCSKDDNNDSIVDAGQQQTQQQEDVVVKEKCITVTGKATSQSGLSKFAVKEEGGKHKLSFTGDEKISGEGTYDLKTETTDGEGNTTTTTTPCKIHFEDAIINSEGAFTATVYYPDVITDPTVISSTPIEMWIEAKDYNAEDKVVILSSLDNVQKVIRETGSATLTVTSVSNSGNDEGNGSNGEGNGNGNNTPSYNFSFGEDAIVFSPNVAILENKYGADGDVLTIYYKTGKKQQDASGNDTEEDEVKDVTFTKYQFAVVAVGTPIKVAHKYTNDEGEQEDVVTNKDRTDFEAVKEGYYKINAPATK